MKAVGGAGFIFTFQRTDGSSTTKDLYNVQPQADWKTTAADDDLRRCHHLVTQRPHQQNIRLYETIMNVTNATFKQNLFSLNNIDNTKLLSQTNDKTVSKKINLYARKSGTRGKTCYYKLLYTR